MIMIDFTNCPIRNKTYAGANGCVSEYLGCHIFNMLALEF